VRIGYGRVSTRDQNPDSQRDALAAAGCDKILVDRASGKLARRPELDKALLVARAGDRLVVTKLDRLGRSLEHLIALSKELQVRDINLVVLDQGIDTATAVGRMFFQILGAIAEFERYPDVGITFVMPTTPLCRRTARWAWFDLVTAVQGLRKSA
jgi:DNA invertase Pin-like site-specific DNA recombinase